MSKELEMLRNGLAQFGRGAGALGFDVADLRAILARLEAAERVCEPLVKAAEIVDQIAELEPENLADALSDGTLDAINAKQEELNKQRQKCAREAKDALRAYRALDTKEPT